MVNKTDARTSAEMSLGRNFELYGRVGVAYENLRMGLKSWKNKFKILLRTRFLHKYFLFVAPKCGEKVTIMVISRTMNGNLCMRPHLKKRRNS